MHLATKPEDCFVQKETFAGIEISSICEEAHYFIPSLITTYMVTTILAVVLVTGVFVAIKKLITKYE